MKQYKLQDIRNIGFVGHGGSGKTSLAESVLFLTDVSDRLGKVGDTSSIMDYDPDEITIGEITSEILEWYDNSGKKQFYKRVSLDGFLSKERKKQKNFEKT